MRNTLAVAALSLAALFGIAACGASVATTSAPRPSAALADNTSMAREIANIAAGKGGLPALAQVVAQAALVYCDPSTLSHAPDVRSSASATCGINYAIGRLEAEVIVTFDNHGNPVADWADLGTEVLLPADGQLLGGPPAHRRLPRPKGSLSAQGRQDVPRRCSLRPAPLCSTPSHVLERNDGKTGSRPALRARAGSGRGRRRRPVLQAPILGTADSERRNRPGVRGVRLEVPEASMRYARPEKRTVVRRCHWTENLAYASLVCVPRCP